MILNLVTYPDKRLNQKSLPIDVTNITDEIKELAKDMAETLYANNGVGLSAIQVGKPIRMIVMDLIPDQRSDYKVYLNPEIVYKKGKSKSKEGCLSVPFVFDFVDRAKEIEFRAYDLDGSLIEFEAEGLKSYCLQHEIDHLDGITLMDKFSRLKKRFALEAMERVVKNGVMPEITSKNSVIL